MMGSSAYTTTMMIAGVMPMPTNGTINARMATLGMACMMFATPSCEPTMMMAMSNLLGLLGLQPPTSNLSVNVTLALMMFLLIQYNGIRKGGLLARMKELTEPMFFLTPLNIIGELALPISLSLRLFGNILAGSIIMALVYYMMTSFMPFGALGYLFTPLLHAYFDIFSGLIQTYIFFTLASFFLSEQVCEGE